MLVFEGDSSFSTLCYPVGGAPAVKTITGDYFVFLEITVTCVEEPGQEVPNLPPYLHFISSWLQSGPSSMISRKNQTH